MSARPDSNRTIRKEINEYLRAQNTPLLAAHDAHKQWMAKLPDIYEQVRNGQGAPAAAGARLLGKHYGSIFRHSIVDLEKIKPPQAATRCQEYMLRWLNCLVRASDALTNAPEDGRDGQYLRDSRDYMDDAQYALKPLVEIRQRLHQAANSPPAAKEKP